MEGDNLDADSTGALGTGLVRQHNDTKKLGCKRDRGHDDSW